MAIRIRGKRYKEAAKLIPQTPVLIEQAFPVLKQMKKAKFACSSIHEERWGSLVHITLPGGGKLAIYQPKHPLAIEKS